MPPAADVTLNLTMDVVQRVIARQTNFLNALRAGEIKAEGNVALLARFYGFFDQPANEAPPLTAR
jgi:alkyl sulfatase BDS1-like metallo-beta-lactamase superfamily hydrolase